MFKYKLWTLRFISFYKIHNKSVMHRFLHSSWYRFKGKCNCRFPVAVRPEMVLNFIEWFISCFRYKYERTDSAEKTDRGIKPESSRVSDGLLEVNKGLGNDEAGHKREADDYWVSDGSDLSKKKLLKIGENWMVSKAVNKETPCLPLVEAAQRWQPRSGFHSPHSQEKETQLQIPGATSPAGNLQGHLKKSLQDRQRSKGFHQGLHPSRVWMKVEICSQPNVTNWHTKDG